jgi:hypothetical protein
MPTKVTKGFLSPISQLSEETAIGGNHEARNLCRELQGFNCPACADGVGVNQSPLPF